MPRISSWARRASMVLVALLVTGMASVASATEARGRYIVVVDRAGGISAMARAIAEQLGGEVGFVYRHALTGFSIELPESAVTALRLIPGVVSVEADAPIRTVTTQTNATWGLDRIDQRNLPLSGTFTYTSTGAGVRAYVIDTGINFAHAEFGGRAVSGFDAVDGGTADDCNGHGTHVAGTVGGSTYGVAKSVQLVAVRVLDCAGSGLTSGVIAGVDWVTGDHDAGEPAVANMSLGGGASSTLDAAVGASIADGVSYSVAAGNGNFLGMAQNACNSSPARVSTAMTIGATDSTDRKASWSNYGNCVDWFAPGVSITSAWFTSNTATNTISGTSMAAPHVAGVAAQYLQTAPSASPAQVRTALYDRTTKGVVTSSRSTNNHLLFTDF